MAERNAIADAVDILTQYAGYIREHVKADDFERHPYLPSIEAAIADLESLKPKEIDNPVRWFFAYSEDAEWWYHGGATYDFALTKALREQEGRPIYIQQAKRLLPKLTDVVIADNVIDALREDECWGEDGWEGDGEPEELQRRLDGTVQRWFAECCEFTGAQLDFVGPVTIIPAPSDPT